MIGNKVESSVQARCASENGVEWKFFSLCKLSLLREKNEAIQPSTWSHALNFKF